VGLRACRNCCGSMVGVAWCGATAELSIIMCKARPSISVGARHPPAVGAIHQVKGGDLAACKQLRSHVVPRADLYKGAKRQIGTA